MMMRNECGSPAAAPDPVEPGSPPRVQAPASEPLLAEQSREDTDAGWGDYPRHNDDRLHQDRPPHWDDF
jgi:hypothetical protein